MQVAYPHRSPRTQRGRRLRSLLVSLTVAAAVTGVGVSAPPASAAPAKPLGPTLVKTDAPPTGYAVTFRYQAPAGVDSVQIYGDWFFAQPDNVGDNHAPSQWQPGDTAATPWRILPMQLGADGIWEITVPLPAGTFRYAFTHDCTDVEATGCALHDDPANRWEVQPQYPSAPGAVRSTIYVPGSKKFPTYDNGYQAPVKAHEAGKLESRRYPSPLSTNPAGVHDIVVYTPHGYDPNRATPYPTLYLSHGAGDSSIAWTMQGVAHHIVENAIKDGVAQPMVVVSTDFNGLPGGNQGYADELRNNVIPFVEQNYHVSTRPEDRAFGGFSAGGSRAFTIMYDNTDLFAYDAAWSIGGLARLAGADRPPEDGARRPPLRHRTAGRHQCPEPAHARRGVAVHAASRSRSTTSTACTPGMSGVRCSTSICVTWRSAPPRRAWTSPPRPPGTPTTSGSPRPPRWAP